MPDETTIKMIDAADQRNAVQFRELLDSAMNERIASQLRDKKMEISNKMFEQDSKKVQMDIISKKKKEASLDHNDIAMKGTSPAKA